MGTQQSSQRNGPGAPDHGSQKTCYYEVLEIGRQATEEEIKKAYRKKALELHPDRNFGDVENATAKFAEVQSAYEVLSDPQERAWYDSHRESILRGDAGGPSDKNQYEHNVHVTSAEDIVDLISRFNPRIPFTDEPNGFYGILRDTFTNLAREEDSACDWDGLERVEYPGFGDSTDSYEDVVKPFYRTWINFSTKKNFSWRDAYRASDAPDRATRRYIERENKRFRDEGIREFNDAIRALVSFVRKRDPRFVPNSQSESDRQKILRDSAAAQAARSRAANQAKLDRHIIPDWAKSHPAEETADVSESEESEVEHIECLVCGKTFKSEKQYEMHEKSKKHIKAVQQLQREMRKEDKRFKLDDLSDSGSSVPAKEFENPVLMKNKASASQITTTRDPVIGIEELSSDFQNSSDCNTRNPNEVSEIGKYTSEEFLDSGDEYAPRQCVKNRLGKTLVISSNSKTPQEVLEHTTTTTYASITSDNDSNIQPRIGKAKEKRAKKASRQNPDAQGDSELKCTTCNEVFPSKNKLFNHIKDLDHSQPISKASKNRNKKR